MRALFLFSIALLLGISAAHADSYSYYPNSPLYIGSNFDPAMISSTKLPCVQFDSVRQLHFDKNDVGTIENKFTLDQITSRRSLYEYLNISASISGHYSFFSGSGSFELETENMFNSDSFTWIVRAYTNYGEFGLVNPRLNKEALALVAKHDLNSFIARCGTEYVGQVTKSVMIAAVYTITNLNVSAKRKLEASFSASASTPAWGGDFSTSYKSFYQSAEANGKVQVHVFAVGGSGLTGLDRLTLISGDIEQVKGTIRHYMDGLDVSHAVPTQFLTGPLREFYGLSPEFDLSFYNRLIGDLYILYQDFGKSRDRVREIVLNPTDFALGAPDISYYSGLYDQLTAGLAQIEKAARTCREAALNLDRVGGAGVGKATNALLASGDSSKSCGDAFAISTGGKSTTPDLPPLTLLANIKWPALKPDVDYWVDDATLPQAFLFIRATSPEMEHAELKTNSGNLIKRLRVSPDTSYGRLAYGSLQVPSATDFGFPTAELPLILSVTDRQGNETKSSIFPQP